jgi:hypothetical protein
VKVYGWQGYRGREIDEHFPETPDYRSRQTREICAAPSRAAVYRATGERVSYHFNLVETGNAEEIEQALSGPGTVFWKPIDDRSGRWARAEPRS